MKNRLKPLLAFFGLLVLILIVSLVPELIGGDLAFFLKAKLGDIYHYIIVGVGLLALLAYTYWSEADGLFGEKIKEASLENVSQDNLQKIRTSLLESYQKRIESKLASRFPINLEVTYTREGSPIKGHLYNKSLRIDELKKELIEIFDRQKGRLLVIGKPGAGKTTLLLQLAIKIIERGEEPIPLIINIATWRSRFSSIEKWLRELLPQMGLSKALAEQVIAEQLILPLFDGLDEVNFKERPTFLNAVANYSKDYQTKYVICSRIQEYAETVDAAVEGQVVVKPLTITQIKASLKENAPPEGSGLLDAILKDELLAAILTTPFYFNTTQLLFASKKTWKEFGFSGDNKIEREREIVTFFTKVATGKFTGHSEKQVKKWLGFLANRMNKNSLVVLELLSLQYSWCDLKRKQLIIQGLIGGLIMSLPIGLVGSLIVGLIGGLAGGFVFNLLENLPKGLLEDLLECLPVGLVVGMTGGLVFSLFISLVEGLAGGLEKEIAEIETRDNVRLTLFLYFNEVKKNMVGGLSFGLFFGLLFSLIGGLVFSLIGGLIVGLIASLLVSLLDMLTGHSQSYLKTSSPYQRFYASMSSLYFSIIQHFHLRYLLYKKGLLPWRLVDFLNEATENNILEADGGSWQFRHRILQDYFAEHWEKEYAATEDGMMQEEEEEEPLEISPALRFVKVKKQVVKLIIIGKIDEALNLIPEEFNTDELTAVIGNFKAAERDHLTYNMNNDDFKVARARFINYILKYWEYEEEN